jgi:c-di-GMP-binding flagellar brake protein YcgR
MQSNPKHSRRRHERISLTVPVSMEGLAGKTRDISAAGLFLQIENTLSIGSAVSISIELSAFDKKARFLCKGNVIRKEGEGDNIGVGVEITDLSITPLP